MQRISICALKKDRKAILEKLQSLGVVEINHVIEEDEDLDVYKRQRLTRVVVGCMNPKAGCAGSVSNLLDIKQFNHQAELTTGVLEEECSALMTGFFRELREKLSLIHI